jgi:hypothetical protein
LPDSQEFKEIIANGNQLVHLEMARRAGAASLIADQEEEKKE